MSHHRGVNAIYSKHICTGSLTSIKKKRIPPIFSLVFAKPIWDILVSSFGFNEGQQTGGKGKSTKFCMRRQKKLFQAFPFLHHPPSQVLLFSTLLCWGTNFESVFRRKLMISPWTQTEKAENFAASFPSFHPQECLVYYLFHVNFCLLLSIFRFSEKWINFSFLLFMHCYHTRRVFCFLRYALLSFIYEHDSSNELTRMICEKKSFSSWVVAMYLKCC